MDANSCLTTSTLSDWLQGSLSEAEADCVADHLEFCGDCEQRLQEMDILSGLADTDVASGQTVFMRESRCRGFVESVVGLKRESSLTCSGVGNESSRVGYKIRDYELREQLGQGAMGSVFEARHTRLNKNVAIKLLTDKLSDHPAAVARFQREMQAVGRLHHPNIVQAMDAGDSDGTPFLVMELVNGVDLAQLTARRQTLDVADACEIARQTALGLQHAHSQELVHRDIKPSNLMLADGDDGAGCVKILDLGLALIGGTDEGDYRTDDGQLMGTLEFMAPEQADDTHTVDHRADIYSLGATLYRLLTGYVPFDVAGENTPLKRLQALTKSSAPSIAERRGDLPSELVNLVDQMLCRDPDDRPQAMSEIALALSDFATSDQLDQLVQRGKSLPIPRSTSEVVSGALHSSPSTHQTVALSADDASGNRSNRNRYLAMFGVPIVAIILGAIWLMTNGSYIRIETTDPAIEVTVEVLKGGQPLDSVAVGRGNNEFWYRCGEYEIRLPADADSKLSIVGGDVTVSRRSISIVTISRISGRPNPDLATRSEVNGIESEYARSKQSQAIAPALSLSDWEWTEPVRYRLPGDDGRRTNCLTVSTDGREVIFKQQAHLYTVRRNKPDQPWSDPKNVFADHQLSQTYGHHLSSDSLTLYFNWKRDDDIDKDLWSVERESIEHAWSPPIRLPNEINTDDDEGGPCLSADGLVLLFDSNRPGGSGYTDLWISHRETTRSIWGKPVNLGQHVNSKVRDAGGTLSPDGNTIIFFSENKGPQYSLWMTCRADRDASWSPAVRLPEPINSRFKESGPEIIDGGRSLLFLSTRQTKGLRDAVWECTLVPKQAAP